MFLSRGSLTLHGEFGEFAEAEHLYARATAILERTLGPEHPQVASAFSNWAWLLGQLVRVLAFSCKYLVRLSSFNNTLYLLRSQPTLEGRNFLTRHVIQGESVVPTGACDRREGVRPRPPASGYRGQQPDGGVERLCRLALSNLSRVDPCMPVRVQERYAEADPLFVRAIEIGEKAHGPDHPKLATSLNNQAWLLKAQVRILQAKFEGSKRIAETKYLCSMDDQDFRWTTLKLQPILTI